MFLLDTDHIGIIQRRSVPEFSRLSLRMSQFALNQFYVSIVSFHEQVLGWNAYITGARSTSEVIRGYSRLHGILTDFTAWQILHFDQVAGARYDSLRAQRIRVGTMDMRIAATALSRGMTVLTRNVRDFRKIPGLIVEDWTI